MNIKSTYASRSSGIIETEYIENEDPYKGLEGKVLQAVHCFCFYGDKLVIVKHAQSGWTYPGGHIESGETFEEAVVREVKEETNMKVLSQEIIGFLDAHRPEGTVRQTRSFCRVEPYGDFLKDEDPEGDITEIKLIDPQDYKKFIDWGEVGDRIIERAMELSQQK